MNIIMDDDDAFRADHEKKIHRRNHAAETLDKIHNLLNFASESKEESLTIALIRKLTA